MMTGAIRRQMLRVAAVAALAGLAMGCASPQGPTAVTAPAGYGKDPTSRVERLVQYCGRLADKGELVTALGLCARAHEIAPDDPEPLMKVAAILQLMNRKQAAVQTYDVLLQLHPKHHEAQYLLGKLYMDTGETDLASLQFNHAMQSNPADPRPYNALGILRDQAGEHEAAQSLYRLALERDPGNFSVRNNLGLSLALDGKRDEAIELLAELAVDPEAGQTVMRNLEAAYASRAMPQPENAGALPMMPASPPANPEADPVEPVAVQPLETEPMDMPAARTEPTPSTAPAALKRPVSDPHKPDPGAPEAGAPTPLFLPPAAKAGEKAQTSALQPEATSADPMNTSADTTNTFADTTNTFADLTNSVILAAAQRLMQPPEWADFEPGELLGQVTPATAVPAAAVPADAAPAAAVPAAAPQNGNIGEITVDPMQFRAEAAPQRLGEYGLSMLVVEGAASNA